MARVRAKPTTKQFAELALNQAKLGGWDFEPWLHSVPKELFPAPFYYSPEDDYLYMDTWCDDVEGCWRFIYRIFCDPDFARAYFGPETYTVIEDKTSDGISMRTELAWKRSIWLFYNSSIGDGLEYMLIRFNIS